MHGRTHLDAPSIMQQTCPARTIKIKTGCGSIYVIIVRDPETSQQISVFANLGKAGGCAAAQTETTCRLATLAVEHGAGMLDVARTLKGISCSQPGSTCSSCSDAIAQAIEIDEEQETSEQAT